MRDDHYAVLGVAPDASPTEIKRAYRRLALQFHPDQRPSRIADMLMRRITEAYEVLRDEDRRRAYDAERAKHPPPPPPKPAKSKPRRQAKPDDGEKQRRVGRALSAYGKTRAQNAARIGKETTDGYADSMQHLAAEHETTEELDARLRERAARVARVRAVAWLALLVLAAALLLVFSRSSL
jgi:curved DNA-binding protein CbpA